MLNINILGFEWDQGNLIKCQKHGISQDMIETFFRKGAVHIAPDLKHSDREQRLIAVGKMENGRPAFVAFTLRYKRIRPISARYMHMKEVKRYEKIRTTF